MSGGESAQTLKIKTQKEELEKKFPQLQFVLWDERLTSQRAREISSGNSREDKDQIALISCCLHTRLVYNVSFEWSQKYKFLLTNVTYLAYAS